MPIRLDGLTLTLSSSEKSLRRRIAARLDVPLGQVKDFTIRRKSLDARHKNQIRWIYSLDVRLIDEGEVMRRLRDDRGVRPLLETDEPLITPRLEIVQRPVIVGCGPAGLFAAQVLARRGAPPLVLERGQAVDRRDQDVQALVQGGPLNPESNFCFGEGGAGTYSDGKLYTRIAGPLVSHVLRTFVALGAPGHILYDAEPHLGSDLLPILVKKFRDQLIEQGVEFRFGAKVVDLIIEDGQVRGVTLADGSSIQTDRVLLAVGHSAPDFIRTLHRSGVSIEAKAFAVGARVEHQQQLINELQYGRAARHPKLPPASYRLTYQAQGRRGVYSFCMCPGGVILPSATDFDHLVVNGASRSQRSGPFANAALVVAVSPDDFGREPLAGLEFREHIESAAARISAPGALRAPAQRVPDFLEHRVSASLPPTSYGPGVAPAGLEEFFPAFVSMALKEALNNWGRKLPGFANSEAVLVGVETRTSSPWRLTRDENCQALGIRGLLVVGEGAGYAGGIVSSAVDGIKGALAMNNEQ